MIPSGDWLPEQGYKLYREVNGQSELIAEQLASPERGLNGGIAEVEGWEVDNVREYKKQKGQNINLIQEMYKQAELTPDKLAALGMSAGEFRDMAYRTDTLAKRSRIPGKMDFVAMREARLTVPNGIGQKIPMSDLMLGQPIYVQGRQENGTFAGAMLNTSRLKRFSVNQSEPASGIGALQTLSGGAEKLLLAQEVLAARQQLATLSFVDDEFAKVAGFLLRDDLSELNLPDGAKITYRVEAPGGGVSSLSVTRGVQNNLSQPQGLMGYGVDGRVPLRWEQAESEDERKLISGYLIERKLDGESGFTQINKEPVVISYMLDETGVYFESPVFFEDGVENGRTAQYRIRALDIFGRTSEYSDVLKEVKVEKVTPPNAPAINPPALSDDAEGASAAVGDAIALNAGKRGIVLPVFTDSPDTVRFTVCRAVAVGAKGFGAPEPIANLTYDNPMAEASAGSEAIPVEIPHPDGGFDVGSVTPQAPLTAQKRLNKAKQLMLSNAVSAYPNLLYFDADIQEGRTYKYWVSAWDTWNNESAWSQSACVGVPTGDARLKWPAYSGEGLEGYAVYRPGFILKPLGEMQQMSRSELTQLGLWRRVNDTAITQNQLLVSGLDRTPGTLSLFLICLEPKEAPKLELPRLPQRGAVVQGTRRRSRPEVDAGR